jgi:hypothetical protein
MKRYPKNSKIVPGKWMQISLMPYRNYFVCCGCGLSHRYFFEVSKNKSGKPLLFWAQMVRQRRLHVLDDKLFVAFFEKRKPRCKTSRKSG